MPLPPLTVPQDLPEIPEIYKDLKWLEADVGPQRLDMTKPYRRPGWTLSYRGVPFAPAGGIHALTGQPGNGKTMTFSQLIVAVLGGEYGSLRYEYAEVEPNPKVLYIDTEMEEDNTIATKNRILSMLGWTIGQDYPQLRIIRLRDVIDARERWRKVLKAIWEDRPTVCFLDGIIDLVDDFNQIDECQPLIYGCMALASFYKMSLWCLIHENPNSTKMVGNLGSIIQRKVTDVFQTIKHRKGETVPVPGSPKSFTIIPSTYFTVHQLKARSRDVDDWDFEVLPVTDWGMPRMLTDEKTAAEPQILAPDAIERLGWSLGKAVSFPARREKISDYLSQNGVPVEQMNDVIDQLMKMGFIRNQDLNEMKPGQKNRQIVAGQKLNENENQLPF